MGTVNTKVFCKIVIPDEPLDLSEINYEQSKAIHQITNFHGFTIRSKTTSEADNELLVIHINLNPIKLIESVLKGTEELLGQTDYVPGLGFISVISPDNIEKAKVNILMGEECDMSKFIVDHEFEPMYFIAFDGEAET